MKAFLQLFTRNWGLKLLALTLAILVFYSTRESLRTSRHTERTPASFLKGPADGQSIPLPR